MKGDKAMLIFGRCVSGLLIFFAVAGCGGENSDGDDNQKTSLGGYWGTAKQTMGGNCLPSEVIKNRSAWVVTNGNSLGIGFFTKPLDNATPEPDGWLTCLLNGTECTVEQQTIATPDEYLTVPKTVFSVINSSQIVGYFTGEKMSSYSLPCTMTVEIDVSRTADDHNNTEPPDAIEAVTAGDFVTGGELFGDIGGPTSTYCPLYRYRDCDPGLVFSSELCMCIWRVQ